MALRLLSFHDVMPSFLDFILTFGKRHHAEEFPFQGFRQRTRLSNDARGLEIPELGRSGQDLSICYNLRSVEQSKDEWPWAMRQTAVYHSFDVKLGRSTWIVAKANRLIEDRIRSATGNGLRAAKSDTKRHEFSANILMHLTFIEWASENWRWYIDFLEEQAQALTRPTLKMSVQRTQYSVSTSPTTPRPPPSRWPTRSSSIGFSSGGSGTTFAEDKKPSLPRALSSICAKLSRPAQQSLPQTLVPEHHVNTEEKGFRIDDLQRNQYLEDKTNETMLVIDGNLNVMDELLKFYRSVLDSNDCPQELKDGCRPEFDRFVTYVEGIKNDLHMQRSRAKSILRLLCDRKSLLFGILEYQNMEASRVLAEKAQSSAEDMKAMTVDMHDIARKTKQETVSMRIITLVTLFFLPGTFISVCFTSPGFEVSADEDNQTLMSTDIVKWQAESSNDLKKTVSTGALRFFIAVTIPLMLATFLAWYLVYRWVKKRDKLLNPPSDIEAQVAPENSQKSAM